MGILGKVKKMGKTVINTTYEGSGAQALKKDAVKGAKGVRHHAQGADKAVFGSKGLRHNVQDVRKLLKDVKK